MKLKKMLFALVAMMACFAPPAFAQNVAKIGDTEYATLSSAIAAASAGQTITLIGDVDENVNLSKNLIVDGANFNYTGEMKAGKTVTVTVKNVNFVDGFFHVNTSTSTGTYTINGCTFDGKNNRDYAVRTYGAKKLTIKNCTVKDYNYGFLYNTKSMTTHSVENVTVENCVYGVRMASLYTTNLVNFVTNDVKWPVQIQANAARTVNMNGCKITEVRDGGASLSCWGGSSKVTFILSSPTSSMTALAPLWL